MSKGRRDRPRTLGDGASVSQTDGDRSAFAMTPTKQCELAGCEGTFNSSHWHRKYCGAECARRAHRLKGKKVQVVVCKNPECGRKFPILHPDERVGEKKKEFYGDKYCSRSCMYDTGITPLGPDNGPDRVGDREKRVVEVVRIVGRGHTNLLKRLNKACDAFVDPKLTFPPKPAHIRLQRDPEDTYLRAKPYKPVYQNRGQKYTGHKARTQVG